MSELKECPFCGGKADIHPQQGNNSKPFSWHVVHHCVFGFIRFDKPRLNSREQAIAAWNTRSPDELGGFYDALTVEMNKLTDEDLLAEARANGEDPEKIAAHVKDLIDEVLDKDNPRSG